MTTPWIPCDSCDDFVCTIHEQHAWECACPSIDVWVEAGYDPYLDDVTPELEVWVADNPIEDEE